MVNDLSELGLQYGAVRDQVVVNVVESCFTNWTGSGATVQVVKHDSTPKPGSTSTESLTVH